LFRRWREHDQRITSDGTARVVSYIPNENFGAFRDATPTCVAQGPDGYLHVGTLDFVSNLYVPPGTVGLSSVWRLDPNANYPTGPTLWANRVDHDHELHLRPAGQLLVSRDVRGRSRRDAAR
jgi:hypothetical protein